MANLQHQMARRGLVAGKGQRIQSFKLCKPLGEDLFASRWASIIMTAEIPLQCNIPWTLQRDGTVAIAHLPSS